MNSKIIKTTDLDPKKQYIFAIHPHGVLPFCSQIRMGNKVPVYTLLIMMKDMKELVELERIFLNYFLEFNIVV